MYILVKDHEAGPYFLTSLVRHTRKIIITHCKLDDLVESALDNEYDQILEKTIFNGKFCLETIENAIKCKLLSGTNIEIYIGMPDDINIPMDYIFLADENKPDNECEDPKLNSANDDHDLTFIQFKEDYSANNRYQIHDCFGSKLTPNIYLAYLNQVK